MENASDKNEHIQNNNNNAVKIREIGLANRQNWIERLWNRVFGSDNKPNSLDAEKIDVIKSKESKSTTSNDHSSNTVYASNNNNKHIVASPYKPKNSLNSTQPIGDRNKILAIDQKAQLSVSAHGFKDEKNNYRIQTHPYLNNKNYVKLPQIIVKPKLNPKALKTEKKALNIANLALKKGKIFTCDAPYPVDVFVRYSLRKRGWVEKFGPKITQRASASGIQTTDSLLTIENENDYQSICDEAIPKPWEEGNGIYMYMSKFVQRKPTTFIWGGKNINKLILKSNVIVNHFPKAKHFSSKVMLSKNLRHLFWHNDSHSHSFFPRCYVLHEEDRLDIIDDFQLTACMSIIRWALRQSSSTGTDQHVSNNFSKTNANKINKVTSSYHNSDDDPKILTSRSRMRMQYADNRSSSGSDDDIMEPNGEDECAADINDETEVKTIKQKVLPTIVAKEKKGGEVPADALNWAILHCRSYINFKLHKDIDRRQRNLNPDQMKQLMTWFYEISQNEAIIDGASEKVEECEKIMDQMKQTWPQYLIDGPKNIWIVKPGDKSKGIGISFSDNLDDILAHISAHKDNDEYIVQKYIERPLLIYKCKFDVRQWFLVTDFQPLTVWFYRTSYLRICSQEFTYDSMHEAVHLSNVAVQENYINGERSDKLPENNFMTSDTFREYLNEIGAGEMWEERIYPGMKRAVINVLVATQEYTDIRKSGFELYGGDFMFSEDYVPWLLEVNSSPGMLPSSIDKAVLCQGVIEDTIKVVLDLKENSGLGSGGFELIYKDENNPNTRGADQRLVLEGNKIQASDLKKYSNIDKRMTKKKKVPTATLR